MRNIAHEASIREGPDSKRLKCLNYAPGPIDTEMQRQIRHDMPNVPLKQQYHDMHTQGQLIDPNVSARKRIRLLIEDSYESGSHIDFYEVS